jgi:hypothetical protein
VEDYLLVMLRYAQGFRVDIIEGNSKGFVK